MARILLVEDGGMNRDMLGAGYDDYDTKPIDLRRLLQKMRALLEG